ncbi:metallophosphoesterase [Salinigranum sp. GCM10025319]|uniref:metallophosphoesterase n=1 Tax=Salinigranum sp. GCM10025319 TaxID=3252687 RepID=UPI00361214FB
MRVGIISDTHDNVAAIERAVAVFEREGVDTLIHCGDFIAPPVLPFFEGFELHGVLGNNDGELDGLEAGFRALGNGSELHGRLADLTFDGARVAVLHGESKARVEELADSGAYDLVCYGHHHERDLEERDGCVVVNPGAHFPTVPREHNTVAVYDTETGDVTFHDASEPAEA